MTLWEGLELADVDISLDIPELNNPLIFLVAIVIVPNGSSHITETVLVRLRFLFHNILELKTCLMLQNIKNLFVIDDLCIVVLIDFELVSAKHFLDLFIIVFWSRIVSKEHG